MSASIDAMLPRRALSAGVSGPEPPEDEDGEVAPELMPMFDVALVTLSMTSRWTSDP